MTTEMYKNEVLCRDRNCLKEIMLVAIGKKQLLGTVISVAVKVKLTSGLVIDINA